MLKLECDRCGKEFDNPKLGASHRHPEAQAGPDIPFVVMPTGWEDVHGKHICGTCAYDLANFLRPLPRTLKDSLA